MPDRPFTGPVRVLSALQPSAGKAVRPERVFFVYAGALQAPDVPDSAMTLPSSAVGHAVALFTVTVWGITFVCTKVLLVDFSPVEILFLRFVMAYVVLRIAAPGRLPNMTPQRRLIVAGAGLTGICLYYLLENIALDHTLASNVAVILATTPLFTAIVARLVFKSSEKLGLHFFLGFLVAIAGICLISFNGSRLSLNPAGDLLAVTAGLVWAFYACFTSIMGHWGCSSLQITRATFGWGLLFMLPFLPLFGFSLHAEELLRPVNFVNLLFLGLVASALCFTTWNMAVRRLGTVRASLYIYLVPVITVAVSVVVLKEPLTLLSTVGTVLTLAGLFLSQSSRR